MTTEEIIELAIQGHANTRDAIRWAIEHEREECAKLCDYRVGIWIIPAGPAECAAAIRRRGEK
jgi:hypothetical protein